MSNNAGRALVTFAAVLWLTGTGPQAHGGIIAHYRFETGPDGQPVTSILDSGPNGLNGTTSGSLSFTADRPSLPASGNFALNATGDVNYGAVPDNPLFALQGDFTVEIFFKLNNPYNDFGTGNPGDLHATMATKQNYAGGGAFLGAWQLDYYTALGVPSVSVSFGGNDGRRLFGTTDVRDGRWHHVALVMDRDAVGTQDRMSLYVDNALQATLLEAMPNLFYGDQPLYIGAGNFSGSTSAFRRNFDGKLDELRISDAALSPSEFLSDLTAVPEPSSWVLALVGAGGGLGYRWRHRRPGRIT